MEFMCQRQSLDELKRLSDSDRHSVLIEGVAGCGKSYLAMQYAKMLNISDFQIVQPKVDEIKSAVDTCLQLNNSIILCIENLDAGVAAASYALLKFLEEPSPNVYIVVTCRNIKHVPDTIISRSAVVAVSPPTDYDISVYSTDKNSLRFKELNNSLIWNCVRTFKDADIVLNMTIEQITYFNDLADIKDFKDTVSNIVWRLGHYSDNSDTPVELVIRYLMQLVPTAHIQNAGVQCLNDLASKRIASHAVLARFVFEAKYCE